MATIFTPASALMGRLFFTKKFALLTLIGVIPTVLLAWVLATSFVGQISASQLELEGVPLISNMQNAARLMQQHRGLSAAVLGGNASMSADREAKSLEVGAALRKIAGNAPSVLLDASRWRGIDARWTKLSAEGMSRPLAESVADHTALIAETLRMTLDVADHFGLTLDTGIGTSYLQKAAIASLPDMLEGIGRLRATTTGVLTKHNLDNDSRVLIMTLLANMDRTLATYRDEIAKVAKTNPGIALQINQASDAFATDVAKITKIVREDVLAGDLTTRPEDFFGLTTGLIDRGYGTIEKTLLPTFTALVQQRIDSDMRTMAVCAAACAMAMLLACYLGIGAFLSATTAIRSLSEGAGKVAAGDLTIRIDVGTQDEMAQIAAAFNHVATTMQTLIARVATNAHEVYHEAERTTTSSEQIAAGSATQSESASSMAASIEQMTVSIGHIADNAKDAKNVAELSGEQSTEGGQAVQIVVDSMERISGAVRETAETIKGLGQQSGQISKVINVIREIAEQTNLLALNAAIEAARAGEQGRGFAVVADEVRKLAERTALATKEIGAIIAAIQTGTENSVSGMQRTVAEVESGMSAAHTAGTAMERIQSGAIQVVRTVVNISEALHEQSAAATEISKNVESIAQMAEENASAVKENHDTAEHLESLATSLRDAVSRFRLAA